MKILIIDNYDSFTYNIYNYICMCCKRENIPLNEIKVIKNDELSIDEIIALQPTHLIFGPGQGTVYRREDIGISKELLGCLQYKARILGICLGHQLIYKFFGGSIIFADEIMHGKEDHTDIMREESIFLGIPENRIKIMRYHSQIGDPNTIPDNLKVIAKTDNIIMGFKHKELPIWGLQFHPESIGTPNGLKILENFLFN